MGAGKTVAIVGESGCGKSTVSPHPEILHPAERDPAPCTLNPEPYSLHQVTRLLTRAFEAQSGHVLVDGQDVNKVTAASLRASVGLVQQEAALFNEDIAYNIAYARDDASPEAVFPPIQFEAHY